MAAHLPAAAASPPIDGASRVDLERALAGLDPENQEILWMAWVEGFTAKEIGSVTGATAGAVKVRLHRLAKRLRGGSCGLAPMLDRPARQPR